MKRAWRIAPGSLDEHQIRKLAGLGWVPLAFFRDVLDEALRLGILELAGPGRRFQLPALDCQDRGAR